MDGSPRPELKSGATRASVRTHRGDETRSLRLESPRHEAIMRHAAEQGLLGSQKDGRITGRVPTRLIEAARAKTLFASDTDLITYALAKVALEDDFGETLLSLEGAVPVTVDLEF